MDDDVSSLMGHFGVSAGMLQIFFLWPSVSLHVRLWLCVCVRVHVRANVDEGVRGE